MTSKGRFSQIQAPTTIVHSNLDQEIIQITEDRLRLVLKEHVELVEERRGWIAPLGVLLAIAIAFATADFRDFYFSAATWEAVFVIAGVLSVYWLAKALLRAAKSPTIDDLVEKVKRRSKQGVS